MNALELITIVVSGVGFALAATPFFNSGRTLDQLGREGLLWFERAEERSLEELPSEDARDEPIPRRPLRGRPG